MSTRSTGEQGSGHDPTFAALLDRHEREIHVHCYRMLASFEEAEDAVQETFLRAWRHADRLDDDTSLRAWLYRVATNVCLDELRARKRRPAPAGSPADIPWLQPYPDRMLDHATPETDDPAVRAVSRETIALGFLTALQALPPRQRAVLIARDVHGWSAHDAAQMLDTTVPAANSALQRARATMRQYELAGSTSGSTVEEQQLLDRFVHAHEAGDAEAAIAIAARDIRVTMPPTPMCFEGIDAIAPLLGRALGPERDGDWKLIPTRANRMPAAVSYLRRPGDSLYRAFKLDLLWVAHGRVAQITTFGFGTIPRFGLPDTLPPS